MIKSFQDKSTKSIYNGELAKKLPTQIQQRAHLKLIQLDEATELNHLRTPPSNHLEALKGNLKGYHSIRITKQWRIIFTWNQANPSNVQIIDYH